MKEKCICCQKEKEIYLNGWCKGCSDKLDKHIIIGRKEMMEEKIRKGFVEVSTIKLYAGDDLI